MPQPRRRCDLLVLLASLQLLLLSVTSQLTPALAVDTRTIIDVCTTQYDGFDFYPDPEDAPGADTTWPVLIPESHYTGSGAIFKGFDVDLRAEMFSPTRLNMKQRLWLYPSLSDALYSLRTGACNMTHGPTTITDYRDSCTNACPIPPPGTPANGSHTCCVDFSHQMMDTGVALEISAEAAGADASSGVIVKALFSRSTAEALLIMTMLVIVAGHIFWCLERGNDGAEGVEFDYKHGSRDGVWWAFVTATTVGYGDFSARTPCGRVFAAMWMVIGLALVGIVLGIISSALTASALIVPVTTLDDLRGQKVCSGTFYGERLLTPDTGVVPVIASGNACRDKLQAGEVVALVTDAPIIQYDLKHGGMSELGFVMSPSLEPVELGIAFPDRETPVGDHSLLNVINPVLLGLKRNTALYAKLQEPWFGQAPLTTDASSNSWTLEVVIPGLIIVGLYTICQLVLSRPQSLTCAARCRANHKRKKQHTSKKNLNAFADATGSDNGDGGGSGSGSGSGAGAGVKVEMNPVHRARRGSNGGGGVTPGAVRTHMAALRREVEAVKKELKDTNAALARVVGMLEAAQSKKSQTR